MIAHAVAPALPRKPGSRVRHPGPLAEREINDHLPRLREGVAEGSVECAANTRLKDVHFLRLVAQSDTQNGAALER
jgi:hypothetical protein